MKKGLATCYILAKQWQPGHRVIRSGLVFLPDQTGSRITNLIFGHTEFRVCRLLLDPDVTHRPGDPYEMLTLPLLLSGLGALPVLEEEERKRKHLLLPKLSGARCPSCALKVMYML